MSGRMKPEEAVVATLSSLPDEVVDTVGTVLPSEDPVSERKRKLEFLEMQEELIKVLWSIDINHSSPFYIRSLDISTLKQGCRGEYHKMTPFNVLYAKYSWGNMKVFSSMHGLHRLALLSLYCLHCQMVHEYCPVLYLEVLFK